MAINYEELKKRVTTEPLSTEELNMIDKVEEYIDGEIIRQFDKSPYGDISIFLGIANFNYDPIAKATTFFGERRKSLMSKELNKRFKAAGWKIEYHLDDGPNMSGVDYWVLKPKH